MEESYRLHGVEVEMFLNYGFCNILIASSSYVCWMSINMATMTSFTVVTNVRDDNLLFYSVCLYHSGVSRILLHWRGLVVMAMHMPHTQIDRQAIMSALIVKS